MTLPALSAAPAKHERAPPSKRGPCTLSPYSPLPNHMVPSHPCGPEEGTEGCAGRLLADALDASHLSLCPRSTGAASMPCPCGCGPLRAQCDKGLCGEKTAPPTGGALLPPTPGVQEPGSEGHGRLSSPPSVLTTRSLLPPLLPMLPLVALEEAFNTPALSEQSAYQGACMPHTLTPPS